MADYKQTPNYGFPRYVQGDPADMRNQYNHAVDMIDGKFLGQDETIANVRKKTEDSTTALTAEISDLKTGKADKSDSYTKREIDGAFALKADKSDTYGKNETDGRISAAIAAEARRSMVWIGDSWSDPADSGSSQGMIPGTIASALGFALHNFAKGGSGMTVGGDDDFPGQLNRAAADGSFPNDLVGLVVIFGGINDRKILPDRTKIARMFRTARDSFPHARIVCIPMQKASNGNDWGHTWEWVAAYMDCGVGDVSVVPGAWYWGFGLDDHFTYTDPGHPNSMGCRLFASRILTALTGGTPMGVPTEFEVVKNKELSADSVLRIEVPGDGHFRIHGLVNFPGQVDDSEDYVGQIPDGFRTYTGAGYTLTVPLLAQDGKGVEAYMNFVDDPYRNAPADYVGRPQAFRMTHIYKGEPYYIDQTFPILMRTH